MGTNYYWHSGKGACPTCGRSDESPIHIGKSSGGWVFALHVVPEENINSLEDWFERMARPGSFILDEYGQPISMVNMLSTIINRSWNGKPWDEGIIDKTGLRRSPEDDRIKHGPGTWDLHQGDFS